MKILTGNDLASGAVTWWAGSWWSIHVEDAVDVGEVVLRSDAEDRLLAFAKIAEAAA